MCGADLFNALSELFWPWVILLGAVPWVSAGHGTVEAGDCARRNARSTTADQRTGRRSVRLAARLDVDALIRFDRDSIRARLGLRSFSSRCAP